MECINLEYRRRLPPELLTEMHKCLPLDKAIYVLVNVSKTLVINNSTRMHRTIQRIKMSLKEHIDTLVEAEENNPEELWIYKDIEWKPQMDALFHYGSWLTSTRKLYCRSIAGAPENFVEKLLLHLANSSSTQMMLKVANIYFPWGDKLPTPTFLKPLFNEKHFWVGNRLLFESIELKVDNGQTMHILDGELIQYYGQYQLRLFMQNKMNGNEWFEITIDLDSKKEFIYGLKFKQWNMQSLEDVNSFIHFANSFEEKEGNTLEAKTDISFKSNLDFFLCRGAKLTQFRNLKIKEYFLYDTPDDYVDFLINFVSKAKHPEEFLESIDFDLFNLKCSSSIKKLWEIFPIEIPKGGKFVHFDEMKLYILSAKRIWLKVDSSDGSTTNEEQKLKFTLANLPSNGEYLFDICVKFGNELKEIVGIKIQKRKVDKIVELKLKCEDQIEKQQGKKRKASNEDGGEEDEDMPTCSNKIMKK